jgi:hypothetical protein
MSTRLKIKLLLLCTMIALFTLPTAEAISGSWRDLPAWSAWVEPAALLAISIIAISPSKTSKDTSLRARDQRNHPDHEPQHTQQHHRTPKPVPVRGQRNQTHRAASFTE